MALVRAYIFLFEASNAMAYGREMERPYIRTSMNLASYHGVAYESPSTIYTSRHTSRSGVMIDVRHWCGHEGKVPLS
jgi:hypothetical protein